MVFLPEGPHLAAEIFQLERGLALSWRWFAKQKKSCVHVSFTNKTLLFLRLLGGPDDDLACPSEGAGKEDRLPAIGLFDLFDFDVLPIEGLIDWWLRHSAPDSQATEPASKAETLPVAKVIPLLKNLMCYGPPCCPPYILQCNGINYLNAGNKLRFVTRLMARNGCTGYQDFGFLCAQ